VTHDPSSKTPSMEPEREPPLILSGDNPQDTLDHIRQKMERVAAEFSSGRLNRAQFNAIYGHYTEQRAIIESLVRRNPDSDAWKQVARRGHTTFLRLHFESRPLYYVVFRHREKKPLIAGGKPPANTAPQIVRLLRGLWEVKTLPANTVARKEIENGQWLVLAIGEWAVTIVIFSLQPSAIQTNLIRDLQSDFERANRLSLQRGLTADMMVFPQRAILRLTGPLE